MSGRFISSKGTCSFRVLVPDNNECAHCYELGASHSLGTLSSSGGAVVAARCQQDAPIVRDSHEMDGLPPTASPKDDGSSSWHHYASDVLHLQLWPFRCDQRGTIPLVEPRTREIPTKDMAELESQPICFRRPRSHGGSNMATEESVLQI